MFQGWGIHHPSGLLLGTRVKAAGEKLGFKYSSLVQMILYAWLRAFLMSVLGHLFLLLKWTWALERD